MWKKNLCCDVFRGVCNEASPLQSLLGSTTKIAGMLGKFKKKKNMKPAFEKKPRRSWDLGRHTDESCGMFYLLAVVYFRIRLPPERWAVISDPTVSPCSCAG